MYIENTKLMIGNGYKEIYVMNLLLRKGMCISKAYVFLIIGILLVGCTKEIDSNRLVERHGIFYEVNSTKPFTGIVYEYNPGKIVVQMRTLLNGEIEGSSIQYYANGQMMSESNYSKGLRDGVFKEWYRNGQIQSEMSYNLGLPMGLKTEWSKLGSIETESNYSNGELHGALTEYYSDGTVKSECIYSNGELHGIKRSWHENSQLATEAKYVQGKISGSNSKWLPDGTKIPEDEYIKMETSLGTVVIDLYEAETPLHAANYKKLAGDGSLEGIYFHRVIPGFVVQGGDPLTRDNQDRGDDGTGGIGERIPAEIGQPHLRGTLGAARTGQGNPEKLSSGSQFYFCLARLTQLDGDYTVFGNVVEGMDVIDEIAKLETDSADNPINTVRIIHTTLISQ